MTAAVQGIIDLVQRLRGPNYPEPGASPQRKVDYVAGLLEDSEQDALARFKRATRNLLFADGRQHIDWNLREKAWLDTPHPDGRIQLTANLIRPILRSRMQRMVSAEMVWRVIPKGNDSEARDRATTGTNFLASRWAKTKMDAKVRAGLWLAMNSGVSYLKTFWNDNIGPLTPATMLLRHPAGLTYPPVDEQGQPHPKARQPVVLEYPVDRQGQPLMLEDGSPVPVQQAGDEVYKYRPGDTDTALRSIFNVRVNPDAHGLEPDEGFRWLLDAEVVPISVVRELYGERARKVQPVTGLTSTRNYERIIRSLGPAMGGRDLAPQSSSKQLPDKETTLLVEYWEPPMGSMKQGRLLVMAGGELLYPLDGEEEGLPQRVVPYVPVYDERRPFDAGGRGVVDDLIDPQRLINKQLSSIVEELLRHGIGQWIMWDLPGISEQITNLDDAHIKIPATTALANRSIGDVVQRVNPPNMPSERWRLLEQAKALMFDIGAFHEIQRGQVPPGVDSGIAVQLLQEAENAQLHDPVRNLKGSLIQWSRHQLKYGRWGYGETEERWLPVQRPDLGYLVESVFGVDLPDPDEEDIDLEGFKPQSTAAQRAEIKEAITEGWMDPRQGLLLMDLGRGIEAAFESQTRHYARARRENLDFEKGDAVQVPAPEGTPMAGLPSFLHKDQSPYLLPQDDDHAVHIAIHQEIALDNTKAWPLRSAVLLHINEHRIMLSLALAAAAAAEGDTSGNAPAEQPAGVPA